MAEDTDSTDYMPVIRYGEDILTEVMSRVGEMMGFARNVIPVEKNPVLARRVQQSQLTLEEHLKFFPVLLKRLKMTESILLEHISAGVPVEDIIPLRDDPVVSFPPAFGEEMRGKVRPDLWKEYVDLKEKLANQDAYIRNIIDTERAILQEINCVTNP